MNEYELAGKFIESANRAFPVMHLNLELGCTYSEEILLDAKVKEDTSRIV